MNSIASDDDDSDWDKPLVKRARRQSQDNVVEFKSDPVVKPNNALPQDDELSEEEPLLALLARRKGPACKPLGLVLQSPLAAKRSAQTTTLLSSSKETPKSREEETVSVSFRRTTPVTTTLVTTTTTPLPETINLLDDDDVEEFPLEFDKSIDCKENPDLAICFVCGKQLLNAAYKGRLEHVKRCSKLYGVTVQTTRTDDDHHDDELVYPSSSQEAPRDSVKNPYQKQSGPWHGKQQVVVPAPPAGPTTTTTTTGNPKQKPVPALHQILLAGARRVAQTAKIEATNAFKKKGRWNTRQPSSNRSCPSYKKISGTDFVVDGFQYAQPSLTSNYFLTHFHSDHYGGITKQWQAGVIYCTLPTANLVHQQLGVSRQYLHPLPVMTPVVLESQGKAVTVTLLDANHCPGAVMILFHIGKRWILHVGDFRWNRDCMLQEKSPLRDFVTGKERLDDLFLDTTYCEAKYTLPTQESAIQATVEAAVQDVQEARAAKRRILLLFGAYTIGKERIYLAVAERLGLKVYVDARRYRILSALEWPSERLQVLTKNPGETCLWVVPLGHITMKTLPTYLTVRHKKFARDFDMIVGFRPTGWTLNSKGGTGIVKTNRQGAITIHNVPYSEHSSFPELVDCLDCLNPRRIIPTVSVSKSQEQVDLLLKSLRESKTNNSRHRDKR